MRGLVINLGLKSIRAIVFDERGHKLAASSEPVQTFLRDSWMEQDADEWWTKGVACAREALDRLERREVSFVTVTASSACLVPLDAQGKPLRRAIMVGDRRAIDESAWLGALPAFPAVRAANSSFAADPYFMVPKAVWMQRHEPELYGRTRWLLAPGDFLNLKLTGEVATDPLNAEKTYFDTAKGLYPGELLGQAGIEQRLLPPVRPLGHRIGSLSEVSSHALGLPADTPVVLATYDALCAFWGSGVSADGDVADVSGTVTSVRVLSRRAPEIDDHRVFTQTVPGTGYYLVGGSNNLGGGLIEWLKQSFYAHDDRPYEAMEAEAGRSGPGARGILFLPYLLGERCPIWDAQARGVFFGLERQHERGDFARAVLESAAFGLEHILATVRANGVQPRRVRVSGGLARLQLVSHVKADVTGLPTEVLEEFETAALGAYLIAATSMGVYDSLASAAEIVTVRDVVVPNKERGELYREWMGLYLRLYDNLKDLFVDRQRVVDRRGLHGTERLENL